MEQFVQVFEDNIVNIPANVIWLVVFICITIACLSSLILNYHWKSYGMGNPIIRRGKIIYFVCIFILLIIVITTAYLFISARI